MTDSLRKAIAELEKQMKAAAKRLEFHEADSSATGSRSCANSRAPNAVGRDEEPRALTYLIAACATPIRIDTARLTA